MNRRDIGLASAGLLVAAVASLVVAWAAGAAFGNVGDWLAGIGAIVAVIAALFLYQAQRKDDLEAEEREQERRRAEATAALEQARREDLDATVQLLYSARLALERRERVGDFLAATIANALAHHSEVCHPSEAMNLAWKLTTGSPVWAPEVDKYIEALNDRRGQESPGDFSTHGMMVRALKQGSAEEQRP